MTALERLIQGMHPSKTHDALHQKADQAINVFLPVPVMISNWYVFVDCMIGLLCHLDIHLFGLRSPARMSPDFAWGRCVPILKDLYGRSGEKAAFEIARTGKEDGMRGIIRRFAHKVADRLARDCVKVSIHAFWNSLDAEGKNAAVDEYVAKWGHLLPGELTEGIAARIRADFPKHLEGHCELVRNLAQIGRA